MKDFSGKVVALTGAASGIRRALAVVKTAHTLIWFGVEAAVGYLLVAGLRKRSDRRAAAAGVLGCR